MAQEYREFTEKTLEDAITAACQALSVRSDKLDYEVISKGSNGFLGFNAKPAVIRARVKESSEKTEEILNEVLNKAANKVQEKAAPAPAQAPAKPAPQPAKEPVKAEVKTEVKAEPKTEAPAAQEKAEKKPAPAEKKAPVETKASHTDAEPARKRKDEKPLTDEQIAQVKEKAEAFLKDVFGAMNMGVSINMEYDKEDNILTINMDGEDMGVLIGKRGQTLDSLQYLISLVVNRGHDGYVHVKADTENYRERRKKTLENLAKNMSFKVKRTKRPVTLEPMNPYERRIIHSALQGDKYVTTYSEGEEPYRKVVIALKK